MDHSSSSIGNLETLNASCAPRSLSKEKELEEFGMKVAIFEARWTGVEVFLAPTRWEIDHRVQSDVASEHFCPGLAFLSKFVP